MKTPWVFLMAFALVCYGTGSSLMESFVGYSSWHLVGSAEFTQFHRFISPRILTYLVAPLVLGTVFSILLIWFRPAAVPAWAVWASIGLQAIVWVSTVTIPAPIQLRPSVDGLSLPLIARLIVTNFWLPHIPSGLCAALLSWVGSRI